MNLSYNFIWTYIILLEGVNSNESWSERQSIIRYYARNLFPKILENKEFPHSYKKYWMPTSVGYLPDTLGQESMDFQCRRILALIPLLNSACCHDGDARSLYNFEWPNSQSIVWVQHRHPPCVFFRRPEFSQSIMDNHSIHPPKIHMVPPRRRIRCPFIHTVLLRSDVDIKYNLCQTQRDESPNVPVTSLINVNISGANGTPCTWFPVKSNSGPHNGTDCSDATIAPEKRDYDCTNRLSSVSSPTPTSIDSVPIQTSLPPLSKMEWYTNNRPVPCIYRDLQGRSLLRRSAQMDANNIN